MVLYQDMLDLVASIAGWVLLMPLKTGVLIEILGLPISHYLPVQLADTNR